MEGGAYYVSLFFCIFIARNKMDMNIENKLLTAVVHGIKALYGQEVASPHKYNYKNKKRVSGPLNFSGFPFLKLSKKGPEQTATEIGEYLKTNEPAI